MNKYCRVCARSDEFKRFPIETVSQTSDVRIDDMLIYCTQLEVTVADNLPQQICAECLTVLNSSFIFRKMCFHSDNSFRKLIEDILSEPEPSSVGFADQQNALAEMATTNFSDICIKQENIAPEEFFDSIVAGAELEDLPAPYPMFNDQVQCQQSQGTVKPRKFHAFICETCSYSTSNRFNFNRHQKTMNHTGSREINLSKPVQSNRRKRKMRISRITVIDKKYKCEDCGYQNNNQFNYKRHLTSGKHLKNSFMKLNPGIMKLQFQCDFCGRNKSRRHTACKQLSYFEEGVPPNNAFGFVPQRVISDTLEIAKLTKENGMPIFTTDYISDQYSSVGNNRAPLKLIESVIDFTHCYAISMQGFRCCKCSLFFATPGALKKHRNTKHPMRRVAGDSINQCGKCNHTFLNEESFRYHKQLEQSKWLIFCVACQVMVVGNTAWHAHSYFNHGKRTSYGSYEMIVVGEKFRCCSCDYILENQEALETHQTEVHFPDWQNSIDSLELHECEKCFKQFATVKQLASHVELRVARRFFRCLTRGCAMEFKSEQEVLLHTNNCYKTEPADGAKIEDSSAIRCCFTSCLHRFSTKTGLKSHIASNHSHQLEQKVLSAQYACDQCDMAAETDQPNEGHVFSKIPINTDQNPEKSTDCEVPNEPSSQEKETPTESTEMQEKAEDQAETEPAAIHKCAQCNKSCATATALTLHRISAHSKYKFICRICGKHYKKKRALLRHRAIHYSFSKFQCPHCPYRAKLRGFLRVHLLEFHSKRSQKQRIVKPA